MRPRRYGSRGSTIQTNDDYGKRFRNFIDAITMFSPLQPAAKSLLYEEDYPVAPFATPRDRLANLLEEPEFDQSLTEAGMAGQGLPTAAIGSVKFNKLIPEMQTMNYRDLPIFDPKEHIGKKIAPIEADLTAGSRMYTGIDSSRIPEGEPLLGGGEYVVQTGRVAKFDDLSPDKKRRIADARRGEGGVSAYPGFSEYPQRDPEAIWAAKKDDLATGERVQADYVTVHGMLPSSHQSNQSVMNATLKTIAQYVKDKRLSKENVDQLDTLIKSAVPSFPGLRKTKSYSETDAMSFTDRAKILEVLQSAKAEQLGSPAEKIVREILSDEFAGVQRQEALLALKPYRDAEGRLIPLEMGSEIPGVHPSYTKAFAGEVLGRYASPLRPESVYPDFYAEKAAAGKLAGAPRGFQLGKPMQEITKEYAESQRATPYNFIQSARQAQLGTDAGLGRFHVMSQAAAKGVVPFLRELRLSPAAPTLTQYTEKEMNDMLKSGKMVLFGLGKDPSKTGRGFEGSIGFGLKRDTNYLNEYPIRKKDYRSGFGPDSFKNDDVAIVSVFNNEPGAKGIAGPGTMLEALRQGGNVLDAFAVPTAKDPIGFLPKVYSKFGFEVVAEIPFSKKYYIEEKGKLAYADLLEYWRSTGWDPSYGMPKIMVMKYTGDPNVRSNPVRRFFDQGGFATRAGQDPSYTTAVEGAYRRFVPTAGNTVTGPNNRPNDSRVLGSNNPPISRGRFSALLDEVSSLSPTDAYNLNIPMSDVQNLRSLLFDP